MKRFPALNRFFILLAAVTVIVLPALAAANDQTITSIDLSPDNVFDNQLTAAGSDSGVYITVNFSGGTNEDPDNDGGYRIEMYDWTDKLVRRFRSGTNDNGTIGPIRWNGQGDSNVNDTLPYGAYKIRAYSSLRDPEIMFEVKGSGIMIDRPADLHVSAGGVLTWTNTGNSRSVIQVTLGDPTTQSPNYLRRIDLDNEFTMPKVSDYSCWGVTVNSAGYIFIAIDNGAGGTATSIAKYDPNFDTWVAKNWYTNGSVRDWFGLGVDQYDSVYVAVRRGGGGGGGMIEGALKIKDLGASGSLTASVDDGNNHWDIAPAADGLTAFSTNDAQTDIDRHNGATMAIVSNPWLNIGGAHHGIWVTSSSESYVYFCDYSNNRFYKYRGRNGAQIFNYVSAAQLNTINGICVWQKAATNETFIIVSVQNKNQILIFKDEGDTATFVRSIEDDPYTLLGAWDMGVLPDSSMYVACQQSGAVKKFDKNGVFVPFTNAPGGKDFIQGSDNTLYLTDTTGFYNIRGLDADETGNVYVIDQWASANEPDGEWSTVLKYFGPDGSSLGPTTDLDDIDPAINNFNQPLNMALWANNSLYSVSREDQGRCMRFSGSGALLGGLGNPGGLGWMTSSDDIYAIKSGPWFDRANNRFHETPMWMFLIDEVVEIYSDTLGARLKAATSFDFGPYPNNNDNSNWPFLIDNYGLMYSLASDEDLYVYCAEDPDKAFLSERLLRYNGFGSGAPPPISNFNDASEMVWVDGEGVYTYQSTTGRYESLVWILDRNNDRLVQMKLAWNHVAEAAISIVPAEDTPYVVSTTIAGETVLQIGGTYFANACTATVSLNLNNQMNTGVTPTVEIKPNGGSYSPVTQASYSGTVWQGTYAITTSMDDGDAQIRIEGAEDLAGAVNQMDQNYDASDRDLGDNFRHFVIDNSPPEYSVTTPPATYDNTASNNYTVSGNITSDATGLNCSLLIENYTDSIAGIVYDFKVVTASVTDGSFTASLSLRDPAPSSNWVQVTAIDKLGNKTALSSRRLVRREKNVGNAYITPTAEIQVGTMKMYTIQYTAAQTLSNDTIQVTVPSSWSTPQKTIGTTNGYVISTSEGTYTDSVFAGQIVQIKGVSLDIGQRLYITYGDSTVSAAGYGGPGLDAPLDNPSNTFKVKLMQAGESTFTNVAPPAGKSLLVPVMDSYVAAAVKDTGPPGAVSAEIGKGAEAKVMVLKFANSNLGNHTHRMTQLILNAEDRAGVPLIWSSAVSKVRLYNTEELITFAEVTNIPPAATLSINPSNFTVLPSSSRDMEVWITISPSATADTVRFFVNALSSLSFVDDVSGKEVSAVENETGVLGKKTGLYDIVGYAPADTLNIGADTSLAPLDIATGQTDAAVMDLTLQNKAIGTDTPVNIVSVSKLILSVRKADGSSLTPSHILRGIHLRDATSGFTYGGIDTPNIPAVGDTLSINLSGLNITSDSTVTVRVWIDLINDTVSVSSFRLRYTDTSQITCNDVTTGASVKRYDDPVRSESIPFQTDTITILRKASATLNFIRILKSDSSNYSGELGEQISTGELFFAALNYTVSSGGSAMRIIPSDTDLKLIVGGSDKTSEFTITSPAAKTIAAGQSDTIIYSVIQNLGSTSGALYLYASDTTVDTRPRLFDIHDYAPPEQLRARLVLPAPTETGTIVTAALIASSFTLDTSYASAGETAVPIIKFQVKNTVASVRTFDSLAVNAISAGAAVKLVRLYHDDGDGTLEPGAGVPPPAGRDTLVASGTLSAGDTILLMLSTQVPIAASGGIETFFVAFDFDTALTDNDTFDAEVPALGIRFLSETNLPGSSLSSDGVGYVEIVGNKVDLSPDSQIVSVSVGTSITLKAIDAYGNIDAAKNYESATQGYQLQFTLRMFPADADTTHWISNTVGLTNVTPAPGIGVTTINAKLSSGQGVVEITDTEAETIAVTTTSIFTAETVPIQYANLLAASVINLPSGDSVYPDSRAATVLAFRVVNQSGSNEVIDRIGIRSLNTKDTDVSRVILFKDFNSNGVIDSGTDQYLQDGSFSNGFLIFDFLSVDVFDADSVLLMVGFNAHTAVSDADLTDAQVDTVRIQSTGNNLLSAPINSTPDRRCEVKAKYLSLSPQTYAAGTGAPIAVNVTAKDDYGNTDIHYTGGTGITWDLTGSAYFTSSTLANEDIDPLPDPPYDNTQIKGNLVNGVGTLTFTDAVQESSVLSVLAAPGIIGTNDTGIYSFATALTVTALDLTSASVDPGDTNRVLLSIRVSASGVTDSVTKVYVNWSGTDTKDVTNVRLYRDVDANELFSATTDALFDSGASAFVNDTVTFSDEIYIANGTSKAFFLVADVASGARGGDTLDARIFQSGIATKLGLSNVPQSTRNSIGNDTVARVPDTLAVGVQAMANRTASEDQEEIIPLKLKFSSPGVADRKFYIEQLHLKVEGLSGASIPNSVIQKVSLRNDVSMVTYVTKTAIEAAGDSIKLDIAFDSVFTAGGTTPETITVAVVLQIASSVTHNETFRISVDALDSAWVKAYDHPLGTVSPKKQKNNVIVLSPASLPLKSGIVTVQNKARVHQQAVRITDMSDNDISSVAQGEQFKVSMGLSCEAGRAGAVFMSHDTDLTFMRANGTVDITGEFSILARSHTSMTDLAAGGVDTISYTCVQGSPFSGAGETLVVNNKLVTETAPYIIDKNSEADASKLRIYSVDDSNSTDAVKIDTIHVNVSAPTLSTAFAAPDSRGVMIMKIRLLDGSAMDTLTSVTVHLAVSGAQTMIRACWIAVDSNLNGTFDSGTDPRFGSQQDFKSSDTLTFNGAYRTYGSGDTVDVYMIVDMDTYPVTDSTQIKVEIPVNGLAFQGQDSLPKTVTSNGAYIRTRVYGTKLNVSPDTQTVSTGAAASFTINAVDTWGNLNAITTNYAAVTTLGRINDTWTASADKSARFTATTFQAATQSPDPLPSAAYYDSNISGKLVAGAATVNMVDTQTETVAVAFWTASIPGETVVCGFASQPGVSAVALSNLMKIYPDSTNARMLVLDVSYPYTGTAIDSIHLKSENTADTCMKRVRLWFDDGDNIFSSVTDSNVDTCVWNNGSCSFLVGKQYYKDTTILSVRAYITAEMETYPAVDNDSVGVRIDTGGIRLQPGGFFPQTGELDSINSDTQNAVIDVDALRPGGRITIPSPGSQFMDNYFIVTVRPEDAYGNLDRVFTTLGSNASKNIVFSGNPAGLTFKSSSMTLVTGLPAASFTARFKNGQDTIELKSSLSGSVDLIAETTTAYPADTHIALSISDLVFGFPLLSIPDSVALESETGLVVMRFVIRNYGTTDSITRFEFRNRGKVPGSDILRAAVFADTNNNGVYDTGIDMRYGSWTTIGGSETASFTGERAIAQNTSETYFIVYDMKADADIGSADGDTIDCDIDVGGIKWLNFGGNTPAAVTNSPDSITLRLNRGDLYADSVAITLVSYSAGSKNAVLGRFLVNNSRPTADSVATITVKNDGTHPDTGLNNLRIIIDADRNGAYDAAVDTPFGMPGIFAAGVFARTDSAYLGVSGDSRYFMVLADISDTLAVDSATLAIWIDTGAIVTMMPDTAAEFPIFTIGGTVRIRLALASGESCIVAGGEAPVNDTLVVTVSVRDTFGNAAQGRSVLLNLIDAGPTILSANPVTIDTTGIASFVLTSGTVGTYKCSAVINGTINTSSIGYADFIATKALFDTFFSNNTSRTVNTAAPGVALYTTPPSFSRTTANRAAEIRYNNADYSVYYDLLGAPALLWTVNDYTNFTISNPGPDWRSIAKVRTIKGAGNDNVVFGGYSSAANYGVNLYYKAWGAGAGVPPTRISPNDIRSGALNIPFDTDARFGRFDVSPSGETVVFSMHGNLARFNAVGATFDPVADSKTLVMLTTLTNPGGNLIGGYQDKDTFLTYPAYSPDGNRIAMTVVQRASGWDGSTGPSDSAEIWVLKNLFAVPIDSFPFSGLALSRLDSTYFFVKITDRNSIRFAWQPHWSRDGSVLFFSGHEGMGFDFDVFDQTDFPENAFAPAGVDFNTYMVYYDKAAETVPYAPIKVNQEKDVDEIIGEMSSDGAYLGYTRSTGTTYFSNRTVELTDRASVTTSGGILFESGVVMVVVPSSAGYGNGFAISSRTPDSPAAPNSDSVIISGIAKLFYNPDTPTAPVYFADSVIVYLYYDKYHFADSELIGFDSDGDGIPDRTEGAVSAYFWDGSNWIEYPSVRFPSENKIQFWTNHFSQYALGLPMSARALAFNGTVQQVIAYPNPWRSDGPTAGRGAMDEAYGIKFTNFPGGAVRIRIYTISGEIVLDGTVDALTNSLSNPALRITSIVNNGSGTVSWNLKNSSGRDASSGVYLVVLDGPGGRAVKKVAIIR